METRRWGPLLGVALLASMLAAGATAAEPPLADAGLDQTVERNATVYLDAGGSQDPDGEIVAYNWSLTAPDGTETAPDCPTCERTAFRAAQAGTYEATVTVTDDDGATSTDTLYVTVETVEPPSVTLDGPTVLPVGGDATFEANVSAGDAQLDALEWQVGASPVGTETLDGGEGAERTFSFDSPGTRTVSAVVTDSVGHTERASTQVDVTPVVAAASNDGSSTSSSRNSYVSYYRNGEDAPQFTIHNLDTRTAYDFSLQGSRTEEALSKETIDALSRMEWTEVQTDNQGELQSVQLSGSIAARAAQLAGAKQANRRYTNLENKITAETLWDRPDNSNHNTRNNNKKEDQNSEFQSRTTGEQSERTSDKGGGRFLSLNSEEDSTGANKKEQNTEADVSHENVESNKKSVSESQNSVSSRRSRSCDYSCQSSSDGMRIVR